MNIKHLAWKLEYHSEHTVNDTYYYIFVAFNLTTNNCILCFWFIIITYLQVWSALPKGP